MMWRVAERVLGLVGGRDAGFVRGRLAHLLPPVVVGLEPSVISPRERERQRWGDASAAFCTPRRGRGVIDDDHSNAEWNTA
jgi:hypothetical protein